MYVENLQWEQEELTKGQEIYKRMMEDIGERHKEADSVKDVSKENKHASVNKQYKSNNV